MDYAKLAALSTRLIAENGQSVTIVKASRTVANPAEPWRGTEASTTTTAVKAVISGYKESDTDGELVRRGDLKAIIDSGVDVRKQDHLIDADGKQFKILVVKMIRPGPTTIFYELQLRE